jgi:hypothetical protein
MAPVVLDLQRAGYDASSMADYEPALVVQPHETSGPNGTRYYSRDVKNPEVKEHLVALLRRAGWPGELRLAILRLDEHETNYPLNFITTDRGRAKKIHPRLCV